MPCLRPSHAVTLAARPTMRHCRRFSGAVNASFGPQPLLDSAADAIGCTPLVRLDRLTAALGLEGTIVGKCEQLNPGYSKKDRIAKQIILDAEQAGTLAPGQPVVELTSGNTGTGLAIVCGVRGYPFIAVMSAGNSMERARMMTALGSEVVLVAQREGGVEGMVSGKDLVHVEERARELVEERGAFRADQFNHAGNFRAHYLQTGPEIIAQAGAAGLTIDGFVDFVGSGGTFGGVAAALHEHAKLEGRPLPPCFIVEPTNAPVLAAEAGVVAIAAEAGAHSVQGGGYSFASGELPMISTFSGQSLREPHAMEVHAALSTISIVGPVCKAFGSDGVTPGSADIAGYIRIDDDEAIKVTRLLAEKEGLFCGFSAGVNVAAAAELLRGECRGGVVAVVLCDSGLKYLSTDLWKH